jgi:hypothetical protein
MKRILMIEGGIWLILYIVFVFNPLANLVEKSGLVRIQHEKRSYTLIQDYTSLRSGSCVIFNDDGIPYNAITDSDSGMGIAAYMDPRMCSSEPYVPFGSDYLWPVNIQVNIRETLEGDKCNGPGPILCSQNFSIPSDSAYPKMMKLSLASPYCIDCPFFLEIVYLSHREDSILPCLVTDEAVTTGPDTCNNWFLDNLGYHSWVEYWGYPPIGDAFIRASGYTNDPECELCGDANRDGFTDIGDVIYLINYLYKNGPIPNPLWVADINIDGVVDVGDVVYLINYLFKSGPEPCC